MNQIADAIEKVAKGFEALAEYQASIQEAAQPANV
jgi:hypothetical protein